MTLVPLPRAALVLLSLIAMAALSLRLFSYEFSIPSEGISGIATTLVPQAGIVILSEAPQDSLWSGLGDEWGGSATYLRTLLIHSGFLLGGTLLVLHAVTCRAPSLARPLLW